MKKNIPNKNSNYTIQKVDSNKEAIMALKKEWRSSLSRPQDGMWASFRSFATHWEIKMEKEFIGYACIDDNNQLLQFYVKPTYCSQSEIIFKVLLEIIDIKRGIVGTNNPSYLSVALNFAQQTKVHTCLFSNHFEVDIAEKEGELNCCHPKDLERIVNFCHTAMGAPKEWLTGYIDGLIKKEAIFVFEYKEAIIGTCEVRLNETAPDFADIGMIVHPNYRKQGYGIYLLNGAKNIALDRGKQPICSCEKENIGSLKSIQRCGFVSHYQLLDILFKSV